jgi:D-alanine-D-alanine ligase
MLKFGRRYPRITNAADFGKVAVLLGGSSSEREISLLTGEAVFQALQHRGVNAHRLDPSSDFPASLIRGSFDRVWIALHGPGGEDGTIQGLLRYLGLPFTGSDVLGSALCLDKLRTKRVLEGMKLPTAPYYTLRSVDDSDAAVKAIGLPLIVKPGREGSSIGMTKVERAEDLPLAYAAAARFGGEVLAESWVSGDEYTAAVLHDQVLPLIRIEAQAVFYDYQAKYFSDATRYHCPTGLPKDTEQRFADIAGQAFEALGAEGWGRVDFMVGRDGVPQILEVNTVPGMTSHSLVPMAARAAGIDFDELVWRVLETSFDRATRPGGEGVQHVA